MSRETTLTVSRTDAATLLAAVGLMALLVADSTSSTVAAIVAAVGLLGGGLLGMSAGWFAGAAPTAPAPLIGRHVTVDGHTFTVVDDGTPSAAAALRRGGRCSVLATDDSGGVGWLFIGLDRRGRVREAATADTPWATAAD